MKLLNKTLLLLLTAGPACAAWEPLDGVVASFDSYGYGVKKGYDELQSLPRDQWNVYYGRTKWQEQTQPYGEGSLLLPSGGSNGSLYGSQLSTRFQFAEESLAGAEKVRISFDLNYIDESVWVDLGIKVDDWFVVEVVPDFGRAAVTNRSTFRFGLQNLSTGDVASASLYQNGSLIGTLGDGSADWFFPDDKSPVTVSFELDPTQFDVADQFALVMSNDWRGSSSGAGDLYYVNNLNVEVLRSIPEPASAMLFAGAAVLLAWRRRLR